MSEDNLQRCPKCGKGLMRPTGDIGTYKEIETPYMDKSDTRECVCDNDECGNRLVHAELYENAGKDVP
jgi:hypothetical protein